MSRAKKQTKEVAYQVLRRVCLDDETFTPGSQILKPEDEKLSRLVACGVLAVVEAVEAVEAAQESEEQVTEG